MEVEDKDSVVHEKKTANKKSTQEKQKKKKRKERKKKYRKVLWTKQCLNKCAELSKAKRKEKQHG